jgi:hypothetical protein
VATTVTRHGISVAFKSDEPPIGPKIRNTTGAALATTAALPARSIGTTNARSSVVDIGVKCGERDAGVVLGAGHRPRDSTARLPALARDLDIDTPHALTDLPNTTSSAAILRISRVTHADKR